MKRFYVFSYGLHPGQVTLETLAAMRAAGCDIFTIGQYIAPSVKSHAVKEYIDNEIFEKYKKAGLEMGFAAVASAPLVRSSFLAETTFNEASPLTMTL